MSKIRLMSDEELRDFVDIVVGAYPGFDIVDPEKRLEDLIQTQHQDPRTHLYGLFRSGALLGGMRLHDFRMQYRALPGIPIGGVGLVAVHLARRKEKAARDLIRFFLRHYREQGTRLAALYPFRPDFYTQMGFGYGPKMHQYRVRPADFPRGPSKSAVRKLGPDDAEAVLACYQRIMAQTHGLFQTDLSIMKRRLENPRVHSMGCFIDGRLAGYAWFLFEKGEHFLRNDMAVRELFYESPEALSQLCTFFHSQADQINRVVLSTLDDHLHLLFHDPRDDSHNLIPPVYQQSHRTAVGLMYRVIDTAGLFETLADHDFNGASGRLKLSVHDPFLPENDRPVGVHFEVGRAHLAEGEGHDLEIALGVADFSSLVMGVIPFRRLLAYGRARISDPGRVALVDRIFYSPEKPVCTTPF